MGLFTDPMTLNDGAASRIFNFRTPLLENGSTGGEYIEPAAVAATESKIVVKHTTAKTGKKRHLLQRAQNLTINDTAGTLEPIVVNVTATHSIGHTDAQVQKEITLTIDALTEAGFVAGFVRERV